ncbi:MAG: GIY-YIG nuclease family protein [Phycisphaerales bacterium]
MVYFLYDDSMHAVKIGYSADPSVRLGTLQIGNPTKLVMLGTIPGTPADEHALQKKYEHHCIHGEWFALDANERAEIDALIRNAKGPSDPLYDFFVRQGVMAPHLCYLVTRAVGFAVSIYWLGCNIRGMEVKAQYQVMRWDESEGPGREFWHWHLDTVRQFYDTPEEAATAFVASYQKWLDEQPDGDSPA